MKQELKALLKKEINYYQELRADIIGDMIYHDENCDVAKKDNSICEYHFHALNMAKNQFRKVEKKLKKLRAMQVNIKDMYFYMPAIDNQ